MWSTFHTTRSLGISSPDPLSSNSSVQAAHCIDNSSSKQLEFHDLIKPFSENYRRITKESWGIEHPLSEADPRTVERYYAASLLTIDGINSIGTSQVGATLPVIPDNTLRRSAIIDAGNRLRATENGIMREWEDQSGRRRLTPVVLYTVYCDFLYLGSPIFKCCERKNLKRSLDCWNGYISRIVREDTMVFDHYHEGEKVTYIGPGCLTSLPLLNRTELVEWDACDDFGNVFALKLFRVGLHQEVLFPFKPKRPGIGKLKIVQKRTPQILLDPDALSVIERPLNELTFVNLCSNLKEMDWTVLRGHTSGIISRPVEGQNEWQRHEHLLRILASAAKQGISLGVMYVKNTKNDNGAPDLSKKWFAKEVFVQECIEMGMPLPQELVSSTLLLSMNRSQADARMSPFDNSSPVIAFKVLDKVRSNLVVDRIVRAIGSTTSTPLLIICPEKSVYEVRRAISAPCGWELTTEHKITHAEVFNRAVSESKARAVLMCGFLLNEHSLLIKNVLEWASERGIPVGCIYYGKGNELQQEDFYLYDNVFEVSQKNDNIELRCKHPKNQKAFRITQDGEIVEV